MDANEVVLDDKAREILQAIEYAPKSGPVAPGLVGLWVAGGWYVCAACAGRIMARGCGYVFGKESDIERVWSTDEPRITGVCLCCKDAPAQPAVAPNAHRNGLFHVHVDGNAILVCIGDHGPTAACVYRRYVPEGRADA